MMENEVKTKKKSIAEIFWQNVLNELEDRGETPPMLEGFLNKRSYVSNSRKQGSLPKAPLIEKIAEYLCVDCYVLFIDEENDTYPL